tara:strand:- start:14 stop:829 length:816 start_codon:yes stop_codon:yes gene_type:complete
MATRKKDKQKKPNKQAQTSTNGTRTRQSRDRDKNSFNDPSDFLSQTYKIELMHLATGNIVSFKAWVTSFSDSYASNWNTEEAYGRMDPITTFQNTARTITLEWDVIAAHKSEAKENMADCELLFKMLYPTYVAGQDSAGSISGAPLFKMKFGNLITKAGTPANSGVATSGLVGTMGGFEFTPDFDAGFFLEKGNMYPQYISLSAEFQVVHNFQVGWNEGQNEFRTRNFPYGPTGMPSGGTTQSPKKQGNLKQKAKIDEKLTWSQAYHGAWK